MRNSGSLPLKPNDQAIYTLSARDHIMLEFTRDYLKITSEVMHRGIQELHIAIQKILASKNVKYAELKPALVSLVNRNETGFLFDSRCIKSSWCGLEVAKEIIPLFDKDTTQSVLCGDLLGDD